MTDKNENDKLIRKTAQDILLLARSLLTVRLRFLDMAIGRLALVPEDGKTLATDGMRIIYDPRHVIRSCKMERERPARDYLHMLLHCIYSHMFVGSLAEPALWDLACDMAVESTINDLGLDVSDSYRRAAQTAETIRLASKVKMLTAEKLYSHFLESDMSDDEAARLRGLFAADDHSGWHKPRRDHDIPDSDEQEEKKETAGQEEDVFSINMPSPDLGDEWKEIAEKVQDALETFFKEQGDSKGGLIQNLKEVNRERYDYAAFLKKFSVLGETVGVNDEEFDYIFYTYGLDLYGNMPIVEPLEYKEVKRIREFVIAIDTSASTSGDLVQGFLQKTYNILKTSGSYFSRINVHIIQCDADIQEHVRITSEEEFDSYISSMSIHGLGGTDFRPVFSFVDGLIAAGEFTDLKGLIYFTDGYGTFPPRKPDYETAFVFLDEEYNSPDVPPWAMKLVLQKEDIGSKETSL